MTTLGLLDGIGSKSNLIYWERILDNIGIQIEDKKEYEMSLEDAIFYPLWLLASSEFVFSLLRRKMAINEDREKLLDSGYSKLVELSEQILTPESYNYVRHFEVIRNTLVHKGFPNSYRAPMEKVTNDERIYETVQNSMKQPKYYFEVKLMTNTIKSEMGRNKC